MSCLKPSIHGPGPWEEAQEAGAEGEQEVGRGHAQAQRGEDQERNRRGLAQAVAEGGAHEGRGAGRGHDRWRAPRSRTSGRARTGRRRCCRRRSARCPPRRRRRGSGRGERRGRRGTPRSAGDWSWKPQPTCCPPARSRSRTPRSAQNETRTPAVNTSPCTRACPGVVPRLLHEAEDLQGEDGQDAGHEVQDQTADERESQGEGKPGGGGGRRHRRRWHRGQRGDREVHANRVTLRPQDTVQARERLGPAGGAQDVEAVLRPAGMEYLRGRMLHRPRLGREEVGVVDDHAVGRLKGEQDLSPALAASSAHPSGPTGWARRALSKSGPDAEVGAVSARTGSVSSTSARPGRQTSLHSTQSARPARRTSFPTGRSAGVSTTIGSTTSPS